MFTRNFKYIVDQLGELRGKRYSLQDLADLFNFKRLTIHKWLSGKTRKPDISSIESICKKINESLGWYITSEVLLNENITKLNKYSIKAKMIEQEMNLILAYKMNLLNNAEICARLTELRNNMGWTFVDVANKIDNFFADKEDPTDYHISSTHIFDIEKGNTVDFHINKLRALATIYGVKLEFILFGTEKPNEPSIDRRNNRLIIPLGETILKHNTDVELLEILNQMAANLKLQDLMLPKE